MSQCRAAHTCARRHCAWCWSWAVWCASVELALAAEPLDGDPSTGCVSSCMLSVSMSLRSCCSSSSKRKPGASDTVSPADWGEKKLSLGEREEAGHPCQPIPSVVLLGSVRRTSEACRAGETVSARIARWRGSYCTNRSRRQRLRFFRTLSHGGDRARGGCAWVGRCGLGLEGACNLVVWNGARM